MRQYRNEKAGKLKRAASHIRTDLGTEEALRLLGRDYLRHPINPLICTIELSIVEGNRRHAGVLLEAGPDAEVPICVTDEVVTEDTQIEIMLESAIHTRGLSPFEEFLGAEKWMKRNPGSTAEQLADRIGRSPSMMSRILSLNRCIPAVRDAAASGLLSVSEWPQFSRVSEREAHELLAGRLSGQIKSRDDIGRAVRRSRNGSEPKVRVARCKCPLPASKVCVTLAKEGEGLGLDDVIEAGLEIVKLARRSKEENQSVETFQKVLRDKAKADGQS